MIFEWKYAIYVHILPTIVQSLTESGPIVFKITKAIGSITITTQTCIFRNSKTLPRNKLASLAARCSSAYTQLKTADDDKLQEYKCGQAM